MPRHRVEGEGRNRTPNVLLTAKNGRFFRLIKHYSGTTQNYTFITPSLTLPLTVTLLTIFGALRRLVG